MLCQTEIAGGFFVSGGRLRVVGTTVQRLSSDDDDALGHFLGGVDARFERSVVRELSAAKYNGCCQLAEAATLLTFDNCTLEEWRATAMGAGTLGQGAHVVIRGSTMRAIDGPTFHGAWMLGSIPGLPSSSLVANDTSISNVTTKYDAGWAAIWLGSHLEMHRCALTDCSAGNQAGVFELKGGSTLACTECTFSRCSAKACGFCRVTDAGSVATFTACTVDDATALANAGAFLVEGGGKLVLRATTVSRCAAGGEGGALLARTGGIAELFGASLFYRCTATAGGAIAVSAATLRWRGADDAGAGAEFPRVLECAATDEGGGLYTVGSSTVIDIDGGTIDGATAANGGGWSAVSTGSAILRASGLTIANCRATNSGGGLHVRVATVSLNGVRFVGCFANSPQGGGGAVFVAISGIVTMVASIIEACVAVKHGSAVYSAAGAVATLSSSTIANCSSADVYQSRGALYVIGRLALTDGSVVVNSSGGYTGGLNVAAGGEAAVVDSSFIGCDAPGVRREAVTHARTHTHARLHPLTNMRTRLHPTAVYRVTLSCILYTLPLCLRTRVTAPPPRWSPRPVPCS